jgi:hypothetical protein
MKHNTTQHQTQSTISSMPYSSLQRAARANKQGNRGQFESSFSAGLDLSEFGGSASRQPSASAALLARRAHEREIAHHQRQQDAAMRQSVSTRVERVRSQDRNAPTGMYATIVGMHRGDTTVVRTNTAPSAQRTSSGGGNDVRSTGVVGMVRGSVTSNDVRRAPSFTTIRNNSSSSNVRSTGVVGMVRGSVITNDVRRAPSFTTVRNSSTSNDVRRAPSFTTVRNNNSANDVRRNGYVKTSRRSKY